MANEFIRFPIDGGDTGVWASYLLDNIKDLIGNYTCYLYDDSGTLKVSKGQIGIYNGVNYGISKIDTITTISLAAVSNSNWAKIEMSISGSAVSFAAADIAGATNPASAPTDFTNAYNPEKGGFYITSTKRCIGIVYVNASGTLTGIINEIGNDYGWTGYNESDSTGMLPYIFEQHHGNTEKTQNGNRVFNENVEMGQNCDISGNCEITGYVKSSLCRRTAGTIYQASRSEDQIFDAMSSAIPNTGDSMIVSGACNNDLVISYAYRTNATTITLYGLDVATGNQQALAIVNGSSDTVTDVTLSW